MIKQEELLLSDVSKELSQMLECRFGYRNEGYGGSGEHNAFEVIKFEMCELGNEDIVDFFKENYGLKVPVESFSKAWNDGDLEEEDVDKIIEDMKSILKEKFGHTELFVVWLTTLEGVKSNYLDFYEEDDEESEEDGDCEEDEKYEDGEYVNKYFFSDGLVMPISDLGDQGTLFVMAEHPDRLSFEELCIK